jgi:hypothetical protein
MDPRFRISLAASMTRRRFYRRTTWAPSVSSELEFSNGFPMTGGWDTSTLSEAASRPAREPRRDAVRNSGFSLSLGAKVITRLRRTELIL